MEIIRQAEALIDDLASGQGTASLLDARAMLCQLVDEIKAYKAGSEEAYGVLVDAKRELEAKVKNQFAIIETQQKVILDLQAKLAKREPIGYRLEGTDIVEFTKCEYHAGPEWTPLYE